MPTWPLVIATTHFDQGTDSPATARADLLKAIEGLNAIIELRDQPGGIASLDATGKIPAALLSGDNLLGALAAVDGVGSGLDADLLDGKQDTEFIWANGVVPMETSAPWSVTHPTTSGSGVVPFFIRHSRPTGSAPGAGFYCEFDFSLDNASRVGKIATALTSVWTDATASSEDAYLSIGNIQAGSMVEQVRFQNRCLHLVGDLAGHPDAPATGTLIYSYDGALWYRSAGGGEVGPLANASGGGTSHTSLTNKDVDDHLQYLPVDGSRAMAGTLNVGENFALFTHLASDPSAPSAGTSQIYFKADGFYIQTPAGGIGPIDSTSATVHNTLSGRSATDAHSQYALLQQVAPATKVEFNAANGDFDFVVRTVNLNNAIHADGAQDAVGFGFSATMLGRVHILGSASLDGLYVGTASGSANGIKASPTGTGIAIYGIGDSGRAVYAYRNKVTPTSGHPVLEVYEDHASSPETALIVRTDGTGSAAQFYVASLGEILRVGATTLTINPGSANYDLVVNGDTIAALLQVDASADAVQINSSATTGRLNIERTGNTALYVASTAGFAALIQSTSAEVGEGALKVSSADGYALRAESTGGTCIGVYRDIDSSAPVVDIHQDHASAAGIALKIRQDGTGYCIRVDAQTTTVFGVTAAGHTQVVPSLTSTSSTEEGMRVIAESAPASASSAVLTGLEISHEYSASQNCTGSVVAAKSRAYTTGGIGTTVATLIGHDFVAEKTSDQAVTNAFAIRAQVKNTDATTAITNGAAIEILAPDETGAITNLFGIRQQGTEANALGGSLAIGQTTVPDASALLELESTSKGLLFPRMTTTQRDAIGSPANGLVIFNSTAGKFQGRAGGAWVDLH